METVQPVMHRADNILAPLGIDRYDHTDTDTDYPLWIHIKPINLFGFISNRYRYICLDPYQTDTDKRFKPILTYYLQVLLYISANFTDTDTDYPVWIYIKPIPIPI